MGRGRRVAYNDDMLQTYYDRLEAGQVLAAHLRHWTATDLVVLALGEGGVPIAHQVAKALGATLDVFLVRELTLPFDPERPMGAVASGGVQIIDQSVIESEKIPEDLLSDAAESESVALERLETIYREGRPEVNIANRPVIVVDDGVATDFTLKAAIIALRQLRPRHLIVALPVATQEVCAELAAAVDELVCPLQPAQQPVHVAGLWYSHFQPLQEQQVREYLSVNAG